MVDAGWNQLVHLTSFKSESAGRMIVLVDPRGTSQLCTNCGETEKVLSVRVHRCDHFGYVSDPDENATRNILQRALIS
ncbi:transposase [Paenibacillus sp. P25]|nr:transposase [Paenibacillus sp. P25]